MGTPFLAGRVITKEKKDDLIEENNESERSFPSFAWESNLLYTLCSTKTPHKVSKKYLKLKKMDIKWSRSDILLTPNPGQGLRPIKPLHDPSMRFLSNEVARPGWNLFEIQPEGAVPTPYPHRTIVNVSVPEHRGGEGYGVGTFSVSPHHTLASQPPFLQEMASSYSLF